MHKEFKIRFKRVNSLYSVARWFVLYYNKILLSERTVVALLLAVLFNSRWKHRNGRL